MKTTKLNAGSVHPPGSAKPIEVAYLLKTKAEDGGTEEACLRVRGKGAVELVQIEVHYALTWMPPGALVTHLRQIADQIEGRWPNA